ncbi:MAG: hypothetical protein VX986_06935 [Pseudomonadota bacterium]|nr:hypothetical protein [Pseudomonadota bacterium]
MATIDSWDPAKLVDYTALYPYLGTEIVWFIIAISFWLYFHWALIRFDNNDFRDSFESK